MKAKQFGICLIAAAILPGIAFGMDNKLLLNKIVSANNIRPLQTKPREETPKYNLGRALFFDNILSGNRDIACATCHIVDFGTSDGLSISIGPGGRGLGPKRTLGKSALRHPRNALDLWNRDNLSVTSMFWDGRIDQPLPNNGVYRTPLGDQLPQGLENLLAVQALFPIVTPDEMLGDNLAPIGKSMQNEFVAATEHLPTPARENVIFELVMTRLLGTSSEARTDSQEEYNRLFNLAYPEYNGPFTIVHLANAIAHYEELEFATRDTAWDQYLRGEHDAISDEAVKGAILFFGKGKCAVCHSGPLFSDYSYHSIGVPQTDSELASGRFDVGRFAVTENLEDMYKFRTPPLRNVTLTAPYFHNGSAKCLSDAIAQHLDPYQFADLYLPDGRFAMTPDQISGISPILQFVGDLTDPEITQIIRFLEALKDDADAPNDFVLTPIATHEQPVAVSEFELCQ